MTMMQSNRKHASLLDSVVESLSCTKKKEEEEEREEEEEENAKAS